MSSQRMSMSALISHINKKFGTNTLVSAREAIGLVKPRYSSGCLALDLVLGGGCPEGAVEILEGDRTSSKSWNMHCRARSFLNTYPDAVYILVDAERTNDPVFLETLGVDLDRTFIITPDSGEHAWDVAIEIAREAKKVFLGVDSLDYLVPMSEDEKDVGETQVAPAAKMNNRGFRKLINCMKSDITQTEQRITACFITQLRQNIGVMFGDPNVSVGGKGKQYAALQIIRYSRIRYLRTEKDDKNPLTYGLEIEATVIKSKGAGEGEKVRFNIYKENYEGFRRGEIDNVTCIVPYLIRYGIIAKAGAWLTFPNGDRVQGDEGASKYLKENPDYMQEMMDIARQEHSKRYTAVAEPAASETPPPEQKPVKTTSKLGKFRRSKGK